MSRTSVYGIKNQNQIKSMIQYQQKKLKINNEILNETIKELKKEIEKIKQELIQTRSNSKILIDGARVEILNLQKELADCKKMVPSNQQKRESSRKSPNKRQPPPLPHRNPIPLRESQVNRQSPPPSRVGPTKGKRPTPKTRRTSWNPLLNLSL